jgi:hypothetical protein
VMERVAVVVFVLVRDALMVFVDVSLAVPRGEAEYVLEDVAEGVAHDAVEDGEAGGEGEERSDGELVTVGRGGEPVGGREEVPVRLPACAEGDARAVALAVTCEGNHVEDTDAEGVNWGEREGAREGAPERERNALPVGAARDAVALAAAGAVGSGARLAAAAALRRAEGEAGADAAGEREATEAEGGAEGAGVVEAGAEGAPAALARGVPLGAPLAEALGGGEVAAGEGDCARERGADAEAAGAAVGVPSGVGEEVPRSARVGAAAAVTEGDAPRGGEGVPERVAPRQ